MREILANSRSWFSLKCGGDVSHEAHKEHEYNQSNTIRSTSFLVAFVYFVRNRFIAISKRCLAEEPQALRSNINKVEVAEAYRRPASSVILASAKATRLPIDTTLPSARTGPVSTLSPRW